MLDPARRLSQVLSFAILLAWLPRIAPAAGLPQDHPWQVTLRGFLQTVTPDAVTIKETAWQPGDYQKLSLEELYRHWTVLGNASRMPRNNQFSADPKHFTLAGIEREDGIYSFLGPAGMAWWTQFAAPGNPFYGVEPAKRRALVVAIVDMIMLESSWSDPRNIKPDFMGANLGIWAYTYLHAKDLLPQPAQQAFEQGMLYYLTHMERLAPRDGNTNMDMREIATLATLHKVFPDPALRKRFVATARRILFGEAHRGPDTTDPRRGTFHAGGYIGEADGPETSYNGISLFHLLEAAMTTHGDPAWDAFMPEVIDRMLRFKAYNTFPEPDGSWNGPSSWSTRTNDPYTRDQRDRPWRPMASAMLSDEGLYLLRAGAPQPVAGGKGGGNRSAYGDRQTMLQQIRQGELRISRAPIKGEGPGGGTEPVKWHEDHWPSDLPYTWDDYIDGAYAKLMKQIESGSDLLLPPYARTADFSVNFDSEFWAFKKGHWGFQVEAIPHHSRGYDAGNSGALAGGSLAAFWTKQSGLVLLGRLPDKWNYVTWSPKEGVKEENRWSVDRWTTHHLWGRTKSGNAFSSARQRHPAVSFELEGKIPTVRVVGSIGERGTVDVEKAIADDGHIVYKRTFEQLPEGLRITSELLSRGDNATEHRGVVEDRRDEVTEIWENLPLYIGPAARGDNKRGPAAIRIEYRVNNGWQEAKADPADGVEAVRVTRSGHPVLIQFTTPQRMDLQDEVVRTSYQSQDLIQNLRVDLLRSGGKAVLMPQKTAVQYTIRTGE